jgi:hypothetical protein
MLMDVHAQGGGVVCRHGVIDDKTSKGMH